MAKPLENGDKSHTPEEIKSSDTSSETSFLPVTVSTVLDQTSAHVSHNILSADALDVLKAPRIHEGELRQLREATNKHPAILRLKELDTEIATASPGNAGGVDLLVQGHIQALTDASQAFLADVKKECERPTMDLVNTRVMLHIAYSNAKALSAGRHKNPIALNALREWQATMATENPAAVAKLVASYVTIVNDETAAEKPDFIWLNQWIDLCIGFDPSREPELREKFHAAAERRCDFWIAKIEAELDCPSPNMAEVNSGLSMPPNYYAHLKPGSTVPDRMQALQRRIDALGTK